MSFKELYFHIVTIAICGSFLSSLAFADNQTPYGTTWQLKCDQKENGREVVCWIVEIPNQPVPGIDIPFEENK